MSRRIALWSCPRTVSTAVLRAFAQRADTVCVDEPLYAAYLRASGKDHPMRQEILAAGDPDLDAVEAPVVFEKHMAHHLNEVSLEPGFFAARRHAYLIRDPAEVILSMRRDLGEIGPEDLGFDQQARLWRRWPGPVVAARDLLDRPEGILRALCRALDLEFDPAMLSWPPGRHPSYGVWAPFWYRTLEASTGFQPYRPKEEPFPAELEPLLAWARPYHEELAAVRLRPES
ncbi:MAG: HAD family hydrolase [Planctomycetota bacterium]|nr:MAG: HAD family hydrolase [Planctomycetota bacterium]